MAPQVAAQRHEDRLRSVFQGFRPTSVDNPRHLGSPPFVRSRLHAAAATIGRLIRIPPQHERQRLAHVIGLSDYDTGKEGIHNGHYRETTARRGACRFSDWEGILFATALS